MSKVLDALREAAGQGNVRRIVELSRQLPSHLPNGKPLRIEDTYQLNWERIPENMLLQCSQEVKQDCQCIGRAFCHELAEYRAITGMTPEGDIRQVVLCIRHYELIAPYVRIHQKHREIEAELCAGSGI